MSLERFHEAQAGSWGGYATALAEIRRGRKGSHWIWYIFPQIDGLGRSSTAREYAIRGVEEACAYLRDPVLRAHYEEISGAVEEQLGLGAHVAELMGGSIDALKLASSLTLFRAAAAELAKTDAKLVPLVTRCASILRQIATQGYPACAFTLDKVGGALGQG